MATHTENTKVSVGGRWNCTSDQLGPHEQYCTCCERELSGHAIRMLELDQRTYTYHDLGGVPEDRSQGWFPFGLKCARKKLAEHHAREHEGARS